MTQNAAPGMLSGPAVMIISAVLFGYFGFGTTWLTTSAITGQVLFFVVLWEWTLKGSAIAFALCAAVTFVRPFAGNALYAVLGLISAAAMVLVLVLDLVDTQHTVGSPWLIGIFAAWNAYGSWGSITDLRRVAAASRHGARDERP